MTFVALLGVTLPFKPQITWARTSILHRVESPWFPLKRSEGPGGLILSKFWQLLRSVQFIYWIVLLSSQPASETDSPRLSSKATRTRCEACATRFPERRERLQGSRAGDCRLSPARRPWGRPRGAVGPRRHHRVAPPSAPLRLPAPRRPR